MAGNVPIGIRLLPSCHSDLAYRAFIIIFTFLVYTSYHLARKPVSIVKSVLHRNCSVPLTPDEPHLANGTDCDWAPFDVDDKTASAMLGYLDLAYLSAYAVGMFCSGHIAERMNLRYFLSGGMVLSGFFTAAFGLGYFFNIHQFWYYIIVQICGGLVLSTGWPSVVTCMANWYGKGKRGLIFGIWNSHTSVGNILGSIVAGIWVDDQWGWSFIVPGIIIGAIGVLAFLFLVPDPSIVGCSVPDQHLPGEVDSEVQHQSINDSNPISANSKPAQLPAKPPRLPGLTVAYSAYSSTASFGSEATSFGSQACLIKTRNLSVESGLHNQAFASNNNDIKNEAEINDDLPKKVIFEIPDEHIVVVETKGEPFDGLPSIDTKVGAQSGTIQTGSPIIQTGSHVIQTGSPISGAPKELCVSQLTKSVPPKDESTNLIKRGQGPPEKAISFWRALLIPGVIEFSLCLFFAKLVSYTFLFWLPLYIHEEANYGAEKAGDLSTLFDVGGIAGGIAAGVFSDYTGARAFTCTLMLLLAAPMMFVYETWGSIDFAHSVGLLLLCGFFVNGPYALITTAVSADLGTHKSLRGNSKALATVTAIIDGTGSIGAAVGPLLAGLISATGWNNVFWMLIAADIIAMVLLIRLVSKEILGSKWCMKYRESEIKIQT